MATSASKLVDLKGGAKADINVTPMVDVMLVLLIIFMIVTPVITQGLPAVMPKGEHPEARPEEPDEIRLGIDKDGNYYLELTQVSETAVPEGLQNAVAKGMRAIAPDNLPVALNQLYCTRTKDRILFVKADNQLEFGKLQEAMEIARENCVRVVAAVTEQIQQPIIGRRAREN